MTRNDPSVGVTTSSSTEAVRVEGLSKVFPNGVRALDGVDLEVRQGEFLVIIGLSGSAWVLGIAIGAYEWMAALTLILVG
mgnify:CR=1 FL=1